MNQLKAMQETLQLARLAGMENLVSDIPELDFPHLLDMYNRVHSGEIEFSEAKLGRWLGWMQAAVVAAGIGLTLEDMKAINKANADVKQST